MACKCQGCGKSYKVDFLVPDEIWEQIKPNEKSEGSGLLCGPCITMRIEMLGKYNSYEVKEITIH